MNTKGIKFLAVLAVMVMAFAAIVALAPADKDTEAVIVYGDASEVDDVDPTIVDTAGKYYISEDATVKIKNKISGETVIPFTGDITFYVQNGMELELNIKGIYQNVNVTIVSVTADQQRTTTSTVDGAATDPAVTDGKIILKETEVKFKVNSEVQNSTASTVNQSVVYTAMMPVTVTTNTTSGSQVVTKVWTYNEYATSDSDVLSTQQYATISSDAVLDATISRLVTVAPGQSIQTKAPVAMQTYGVMTQLAADGFTTYYAVGMNAGAFTLADKDTVIVQNGSATVNNSDNTSNVKVTSAKGVTFTGKSGIVDVSEKITAGTMTVSGNVSFTKFTDRATVTFNSSAVATGKITVSKTLVLKNTADGIKNLTVSGTGTIVAENEKLWDYGASTDPKLTFKADSDFEGQYDVYAITKVAEVKDAFSTALIKKNQTFRVVADTVVTTALDVEGVLIIEPGVTLTISKINGIGAAVTTMGQYAQIINNGDILIQTTAPETDTPEKLAPYGLQVYGGFLENNGKIVASSDSKALAAGNATFKVEFQDVNIGTKDAPIILKGKGTGFINNGTVTISRNDVVSLDSNFNNKGSVSVSGVLASDGLKNAGIFTLNGAKVQNLTEQGTGLTVTMTKVGAEFSVGSAEIAAGKEIKVQNSYKIFNKEYFNTVEIIAPTFSGTGAADAKCVVRNITVTDYQSAGFELSGNMTASLTLPNSVTANPAYATVKTGGSISVFDSVTVGKGIGFNFGTKTNMFVSGEFTAKDATATGSALTIKVPGKVTVGDKFGTPVYVAAKYSDGDYTVYTSLENAVPAAIEAKETMIYVGGTKANHVTVTSDITIPEGMTIVGQDQDSYLEINGMATIYVESDAMVSMDYIAVKNGALLAEDLNNVNIETVHADVVSKDEESTAVACMSLNVALALATPGTVIELSQEFYASDVDLTIPEGVIVDATAATTATDFVLVNSNLTVNGVLVVDNFKFIATTDDTIGITVTGYIYDSCPNTAWPNGCFNGWWYTPFGVSYHITDEDDVTWYVLTSIENIQPAINAADDAKVAVEGDAVLDELTVTGRDDMPAEVTFKGDVDIDNINIDEVTLIFKDGNEVTTTVRNAVGSITLTGAYVDRSLSIYDMAIYSSEDVGVYMEGSVTDGDYGTYGILFEGITGMDGTDNKTNIGWTSGEEAPAIIFDGVTTVIGKKAYIQFDDEEGVATGMATITGTLLAYNNSKIIINSDVQVLGGIYAAERTDDAIAGTIEVNGNMFVGALMSDIYSAQDALNAYEADAAFAKWKETDGGYGKALMTEGDAIASGNIVVANGYFITVMDGSEVDPQIIEDLEYLDVVIEDTLWLTVYGYGNTPYSMDGLKAPIVNAKVTTILDAYGNPVALYSHDFKVVYGAVQKPLSQYGEGVIISLDYDVFTVTIKTDGSVKAVYIDGILMYTGQNENVFMLDKVATGTHKVDVEAATGYDASKCVLYTEMGTILPGMSFTFTEFDCDDYVVIYNINGTEIQPEPVPPTPEEESQWTVTTILLVILVVLIAIMAVIVALRLNRS